MLFIDGTNLFHRLQEARLRVPAFVNLFASYVGGRQIIHTYLYTSDHHLSRAKATHGDTAFNGVRVVLGYAVPTAGSTPKEKGVDALLVADLVYHAAQKNMDYAVVVSVDLDFAHALKRVGDFGCRAAIVAVQAQIPPLLRSAADDFFEVTKQELLSQKLALDA